MVQIQRDNIWCQHETVKFVQGINYPHCAGRAMDDEIFCADSNSMRANLTWLPFWGFLLDGVKVENSRSNFNLP